MEDLEFDSYDLVLTEDFLGRAYPPMRICADGGPSRARVVRRWVGTVSVDDVSNTNDVSYSAKPLERICLCRVRSGRIEADFMGERHDVFGPGDLTLLASPGMPYSGRGYRGQYELTMFDAAQLERVAATASDAGGAPVRLTGHRPVSAAAARQVSATIDYLRVLATAETKAAEPVAAAAAVLLAASVLSAFPTNASLESTPTDRNDSRPVLLRRAMAYIDDHAHTDIAIADVAAHVYATPRAVQYVFRRELDMTPMQYLRRVRLAHAHRELVSADPAATTVGAVAARWGFAHQGRFAGLYREAYGRNPHRTLNC